jgi:hypothetical protein
MDQRDRPAIEVTEEMVKAGVSALSIICPLDLAFPNGREEEAVEAVIRAALELAS